MAEEDSGLLNKVEPIIEQLEVLAGTLEKGFPNSTIASLHYNLQLLSGTLAIYKDDKSNLKGILVTLYNNLKELGEQHLSNISSARVKLKEILEKLRDGLAAREYYRKTNVGKLHEIIRRI